MRMLVVLSLMPILFAGCRGDRMPGSAAPEQQAMSQDLAGTTWRFLEARAVRVAQPDETRLAFDGSGSASGTTGCNHFNGAVAIVETRMTFSPLAATRRGCPPKLAEQENRILKLLEEVRRYEVRPDGLRLLLEDGTVLARLERAPDPIVFTPGARLSLRGEIAEGTECPMLVLEDGRRVSLAGDRAGHEAGERVCVRGTIAGTSICMAGEATLSIESIGPEKDCR